MCTAPGGWLILSQLFFFYIADLIYIGRELKLLHKSDGRNAGWVKRFDHKRRGRLTFFTKQKIATFYGLPGIQTNLFLFVVHKDLIQLPVQVHYKFLTVRVCVVIFFFFLLSLYEFQLLWEFNTVVGFWAVYFNAFRMTRGWAVLIVFDRVIAL